MALDRKSEEYQLFFRSTWEEHEHLNYILSQSEHLHAHNDNANMSNISRHQCNIFVLQSSISVWIKVVEEQL